MSISWKNWKRGFAVLLVVSSARTPVAFAQNPTFALEGVVTDAQQAVLPGVTVTIQNTSTGLTRSVTTDDGGRFVVSRAAARGPLRVQVEMPGFATEMREGPHRSTPDRTSCSTSR